jgi:superoxide dismutase, Fe-Mn family
MKLTRRDFLSTSCKVTVATSVASTLLLQETAWAKTDFNQSFEFKQDKLRYDYNALEPYIDAATMEIHYSKHHAAYVKNVNEAISSEGIKSSSEKEFFSTISNLSSKARNNGGGVWNHNFFWKVMKPQGGNPSGNVAEALAGSFGSVDKFKEAFTKTATDRFGSGWAWLVKDNKNKLQIGSTPNQDNPLMDVSDFKGAPLLALDVWEHAYYLKYQNKRAEYISNWWNVVNWDEVAKQL